MRIHFSLDRSVQGRIIDIQHITVADVDHETFIDVDHKLNATNAVYGISICLVRIIGKVQKPYQTE